MKGFKVRFRFSLGFKGWGYRFMVLRLGLGF